jgi:dinuclear metal center YbgI/SA1388 family protein
MRTIELYNELCKRIPTSLSCEWDRDGLESCPTPEKEVKKVLIALDVNDDVIDRAVAGGFDVIASHHPLFFAQLENVNATGIKGARAVKLIKNDIAVMSFHTRLDAVEGGVNDTLAAAIGLKNVFTVELDTDGIMRMGELDCEMDAEDYCELVKRGLSAPESPATVILSPAGRKVKKVALLGGGGGKFADIAMKAGADTYVTGDMNYHEYLSAPERNMNLITAGHFHTEFPVCRVLEGIIRGLCPDAEIEVYCSDKIKSF